jgi:hypothetical protein
MPRLLRLEPAAVGSAALTVYVAAAMLYRALVTHDTPLDTDVLVAAGAALYSLWTRLKVTPLADPKAKSGTPLVPAPGVRPQRGI